MKHLFLLCVFGYTCAASAQQFPQLMLPHPVASGVYSADFADPFSLLMNPAARTASGKFSAGVYGERRFLLSALQQVTTVMQFPFANDAIGFKTQYFGSSYLNESSVGLVYGKKLTSQVSSGIALNYYHFNARGYLSTSSLIAEGGFLFRLTEELISGISVRLPTRRQLGKGHESLRSLYQFGLGYQPSDRLYLMVDTWKEAGRKMHSCVMIQYAFAEGFRLRGGWQSFSAQWLFSAGIFRHATWLDINLARHPYLGYSTGIQLLYAPYVKH
ncbi:MAG: hypothetical protein KGP35_01305 [Bacteroidetes bacterium]|nr:hypothetical protein [Bacteroidota bacterium]